MIIRVAKAALASRRRPICEGKHMRCVTATLLGERVSSTTASTRRRRRPASTPAVLTYLQRSSAGGRWARETESGARAPAAADEMPRRPRPAAWREKRTGGAGGRRRAGQRRRRQSREWGGAERTRPKWRCGCCAGVRASESVSALRAWTRAWTPNPCRCGEHRRKQPSRGEGGAKTARRTRVQPQSVTLKAAAERSQCPRHRGVCHRGH